MCDAFFKHVFTSDEPFDVGYFTRYAVYLEAAQRGCRAILDGGEGDYLFYRYQRSACAVLIRKDLRLLPALGIAAWRHRRSEAVVESIRALGAIYAPNCAKGLYRRHRKLMRARTSEQSLITTAIVKEFGERKSREQ